MFEILKAADDGDRQIDVDEFLTYILYYIEDTDKFCFSSCRKCWCSSWLLRRRKFETEVSKFLAVGSQIDFYRRLGREKHSV